LRSIGNGSTRPRGGAHVEGVLTESINDKVTQVLNVTQALNF
jgi:hypothetical protein